MRRPSISNGRRIYQIGMPFHFGWSGYATGAVANALTSVVGDPNTAIHEGKALTCGLRKGRLDSAGGGAGTGAGAGRDTAGDANSDAGRRA